MFRGAAVLTLLLVPTAATCGARKPSETAADTGATETGATSGAAATAVPTDPSLATDDTAEETVDQEPPLCQVREPIDAAAFPDRVAAAVCALRAACGCENADDPQCGQDFAAYLTELHTYAMSAGLAYDGECAARRIQEYEAAGCNASEINTREACAPCYVYSGASQPGASCETVDPLFDFGLASTCAVATTECYLGECGPPGAAEGEWCWGTERCAEGLACDADGTICASAGPGEPCLSAAPGESPCAAGLWCDATVCRARGPLGASCESGEECVTLSCAAGVCADFAAACDLAEPMHWPFFVPGPP